MKNPHAPVAGLYRFGHWQFDASSGDLFDGQKTNRLEPQVAKLLDYFLVHQNTLCSRDEIMASVWDNRIVSDDAINRCISILRQILSPDDKNAYIETVVRRGFISHFPDAPPAPATLASLPRRRSLLVFALLLGILAVVGYFASVNSRLASPGAQPVPRQGVPMVAVLPFTAIGLAGDSEFFAKGMHDGLLTQLAQLQSLRVISRTSVLEYRDSKQNIRQIGQELGADAILEGSIQSAGDQIRINVQLIDTATGQHLWAESYDRELSPANIFAVQTEIANAITASMHTTLTDQDVRQLKVLPTENMAAYRAYHRAMEIRDNLGVSDPTYLEALESAVKLDPTFVRAWAEMAGSLSFKNFSEKDPASIQRAENILEQIRAIAPHSADYLIAQAYYTYYIVQNYPQAYELIKQAQQLRPSDKRVLELKSWIERRLGDYPARIESLRQVSALDPRNPYWTRILAQNLVANHQYEEASEEINHAAIKDFDLAMLDSLLQLRDAHDPARWGESLAELEAEYHVSARSQDLWNARIASRDFAAAEQLLNAVQAEGQIDYDWGQNELYGLFEIITYWFLQSRDPLESRLDQVRNDLDQSRDAAGNFPDTNQYLSLAFVSAAEGNAEETERLIRAWRRGAATDFAEFAMLQHYSCRALGIAAATVAAVECIRAGLAMPSHIIPFIEPYLPYYDAIRQDPEFVDLQAEIE